MRGIVRRLPSQRQDGCRNRPNHPSGEVSVFVALPLGETMASTVQSVLPGEVFVRSAIFTSLIPFAAALVGLPGWAVGAAAAEFGQAEVALSGKPAPPPSSSACGFSLLAGGDGPQVALMEPRCMFIASVRPGEAVSVAIPIRGVQGSFSVTARAMVCCGEHVEASLSLDGGSTHREVLRDGQVLLKASRQQGPQDVIVHLKASARSGESAVRFSEIRLVTGDRSIEVPVLTDAALTDAANRDPCPPPVSPAMRPPIQRALIQWDWRMQDGIGTERAPVTYPAAIERTLQQGDDLIRDLQSAGVPLEEEATQWRTLCNEFKSLSAAQETDPSQWESLWRRVHRLRRDMVFKNPLAELGPLLFVKQVPGSFSHQLTQYYGRYARPGGGVFVLDAPGRSMQCRQLAAGRLPQGSYQHPEVSYDGRRTLFSYCEAEATPQNTIEGHRGRYYHLYEMAADGSDLRRLTDGPFDDFSPRYLPDGRIVFVSTRRLGWHRCGYPGCENYTLAIANGDGSDARPLSCHETQEWDPAVLADGRIIYTRWDYVDRHAVYYEQLWAVRPDGSFPMAYYGNNTFNPVGIWEARQVPGSRRVMATAGAHHAMTAGSILLVDVTRGIDGLEALTRLTPDAPFPESETHVAPRSWYAPAGITQPPPVPPEAQRWPGHCYRSPYPLSERYFLAAYSFDPLIGEPDANRANMFGIYLVDCFGNKELLYRDLNIASLWPTPLRPHRRPVGVPPVAEQTAGPQGSFFLHDVYQSQPALPPGAIKRLRIVQVLPKSTPGINRPPVGLPNASPGKQVLGTVPVEPDGSAYFHAPAGVPLSFQALDERGQAVQIMRSITYLQPGENASCIGCHEPRTTAPPRHAWPGARPAALRHHPQPRRFQPAELPHPRAARARQALRELSQSGEAGRRRRAERGAAGPLHRLVQRPGTAGAVFRLGRQAGRFPAGQQRADHHARPLRRPGKSTDETAPGRS